MKTALFLLGGPTTGPSNSATRYIALAAGSGQSIWSSTINNAKTPFAAAGTLSDLVVRLPAALTGAQTWAFTVYKNGSATGLTVTVDSGGLVKPDHVHTVSVAKGDTVSLQSVPSGTPTAQTVIQASMVFAGTVAGEGALFAACALGTTANFFAPGCASASNSTEALRSGVMPTAGDISELYVDLSAATGAGTTRTFTLRKNGADTGLTVTVNNGDTLPKAATPTTVSWVAGDVISIGQTVSGTPATASAQIGVNWKPTVDGEGLAFGVWNGAPSTSAAAYANLRGASSAAETTETNAYNIAPVAVTIDLFRADISTAAGASKHRVFTVRKNGANAGAGVDINGGSAVSGTDGTDISLAEGDLVDVVTTPSGTPATVTYARASAVVKVDAGAVAISFADTDLAGLVWEGLRVTSGVQVGGDYTGTPTDVQVRLVDGAGAQVKAWASATTQTGGHYAYTFTGVATGGPYYQQVRDNGGTSQQSAAAQYVGCVLQFWGQSQNQKLGSADVGGVAASAGKTTYLRHSTYTPAGVVLVKDVVNDAASVGSGIIAMHNQWHADTGGSVPLMIVHVVHQGTRIGNWINDDDPDSEGWGLKTGLMAALVTKSRAQATAVAFFQGTSDVGATYTPSYAANMDTWKAYWLTQLPGMDPLFLVMPHPRSNDGTGTFALRQIQADKAASGGAWRLMCWLLDWEMDADGSPHQSSNAAGNRRGGTRAGRGLAKCLYNTGLDIAGPQAVARWGDLAQTTIDVIYDQGIETPAGATTALPGFTVSGDSGATFALTGFSAAIVGGNKLRLSKDSGAWTDGVTRIGYLNHLPFTSDSGFAAEFVGAENTLEAGYLAKVICDQSSFDGGRGMPASPIMGTGLAVGAYVAPSTSTHGPTRPGAGMVGLRRLPRTV